MVLVGPRRAGCEEPGLMRFHYPTDEPPLQPGEAYLFKVLVITDDVDDYIVEERKSLVPVSAATQRVVQTTVNKINALSLSASAKRLLQCRHINEHWVIGRDHCKGKCGILCIEPSFWGFKEPIEAPMILQIGGCLYPDRNQYKTLYVPCMLT